MSLSIDPAISKPGFHLGPYLRPFALTLMMMAEILFLTIRFDPPVGLPTDRWWGFPLLYSHAILKFLLLLTVALCSFGGQRLALRLRRGYFQDVDTDYAWSGWFVAHGLVMVILTQLTSVVCGGVLLTSSHPGMWMAAWVVSVLSTGATWLMAMLSPAAWFEILKRNLRSMMVGVTVAGIAFLLGSFSSHLWATMAEATLVLVRAILGLVTSHIACDTTTRIIGVDHFKVEIGDPCSGYEGIGLVLAFLAGYFWVFRRSLRWPAAYLLLPVGVTIIWLLNAVRIAALVLIGAWASPVVAMGGFHSQAGWLAFLGVSLGLVAVSRRSSFFAADLESVWEIEPSNPSLSFLGPFLVVLATALVTSALTAGFDAFYGLRVFTGGLALWYFRRDFAGWLRDWSMGSVVIGLVAFLLWAALEPASTESARSLKTSVDQLPVGQAWAWLALRVIGSVAIVPLVEELAFRGYFARRLISVDFDSVPVGKFSWPSLLISSATFGLLHGRWLAGMLVGLLYALAVYRRGKLSDAIVAHAMTNLLIAVSVMTTGNWSMWS